MPDFFPDVAKIKYEGPESTNPLAFRHYNAGELLNGKTMAEHLRFAVCYWHTFRGTGGDPFGPGCAVRPWEDGSDSVEMALKRVDAAFEFMSKLGVPFYCFHDRDVSPEGKSLRETNANLDRVVAKLKAKQSETGIKLLWGTANLFSNPRFVHGASTSCNADVFAYAAAQVKKPSKSPRNSAARTTSSGAAAKAITIFTTPISSASSITSRSSCIWPWPIAMRSSSTRSS